MNIVINNRGNGACPDCARRLDCPIHRSITSAVKDFSAAGESGMEMVVFECPNFTKE